MSRTFKIEITTTASAVVSVELSDELLSYIAAGMETTVEALTVSDLADEIIYRVEPPELCGACTGISAGYTMELDDSWEVNDTDIEEVTTNH